MGGAAYIFSRIAAPGVIAHTGGPARIVFGEMDGAESERALEFLAACREANIDAELSPDIRRVLWDKFAFICAQAGITAATQMQSIPRTSGVCCGTSLPSSAHKRV